MEVPLRLSEGALEGVTDPLDVIVLEGVMVVEGDTESVWLCDPVDCCVGVEVGKAEGVRVGDEDREPVGVGPCEPLLVRLGV